MDNQSQLLLEKIMVYVDRFKKSLENIKAIKIYAKFNGNSNYGAIFWHFQMKIGNYFLKRFVEYLELENLIL